MMVNGKTDHNMDMERSINSTVITVTLAIGSLDRNMEKEIKFMQMDLLTKVTGSMIAKMDKENMYGMMDEVTQVNG